MPDPFDVLRVPTTPIDPDPVFAAKLRARLAHALDLPEGVTVSDLALGEGEVEDVSGLSRAVITPYLAVSGARAALDWYREAFGARLRGDPIVMPDGRIGHAELDISGAPVMLSDEHPEIGVTAPLPGGGSQVTIHLQLDDVDGTIDRAVSAGATLERAAADYEYGRNGVVRDPFGHRWMVSAPPVPAGLGHGDIGYVSLWVPDAEKAAAFFSSVLGWRYRPASGPQGRQVDGQKLPHGLWGGVEPATLFCCFAVDDVAEAVARVRAAGGIAEEPQAEPYGLVVGCTDPGGTRFAVFEPPGGTVAGHAPRAATSQGDLVYVTMEVTDSAQAREFYGAVLGWRFSPGRVADGWQADDVSPLVGLWGGQPIASTQPMYQVDDIEAAVARVRAAGGTASDPEQESYGISAVCADDQGTRFYLGQF
jgi:uncharacterized glyoxalase superfamily protein PhnB